MRFVSGLVVLILGFITSSAFASDAGPGEWYMNVSYGRAELLDAIEKDDLIDLVRLDVITRWGPTTNDYGTEIISENQKSYSLSFGYEFSLINVEVSYSDFGQVEGTMTTEFAANQTTCSYCGWTSDGVSVVNATIKSSAIGLGISKNLYLLDKVALQPKVGIYYWDNDVSYSIQAVENISGGTLDVAEDGGLDGNDLYIGLSILYDISNRLSTKVEFIKTEMDDVEMEYLGLAIGFKFIDR